MKKTTLFALVPLVFALAGCLQTSPTKQSAAPALNENDWAANALLTSRKGHTEVKPAYNDHRLNNSVTGGDHWTKEDGTACADGKVMRVKVVNGESKTYYEPGVACCKPGEVCVFTPVKIATKPASQPSAKGKGHSGNKPKPDCKDCPPATVKASDPPKASPAAATPVADKDAKKP
jgi:hypothetical protein